MYQIGDLVVFSVSGVCTVNGYQEEEVDGELVKYYVLNPVEQASRTTICVPVESNVLRKVINKADIDAALRESVNCSIDWIDNSNLRKTAFHQIITEGEVPKVIALISRLHRQREKVTALGKKFPATDERLLKEAEKRIHQELSQSLEITEEQIPEYVITRLEQYRTAE